MDLRAVLESLIAGDSLPTQTMEGIVRGIMAGELTPAQIGGFLVALRAKGETIDELVGAARAMRRVAQHVDTAHDVVDTCGTGGDGCGTFNISTAAALIAAGAGVVIAKHGNRAMSGTVGGADVLEALGVKLNLTAAQVSRCLDEAGVGFIFAQAFHPAMRYVAGVRRELGVRTIFNLLGPLANPAGARRQVLGVFADRWVEPLAKALVELGSECALVVHGNDGLDEISLCAPTKIAEVRHGVVRVFEFAPEDVALERCRAEDLAGGDIAENAAIMRAILAGSATPAQQTVALLNAAAAIWVGGRSATLAQGLDLARSSVADGCAAAALAKLVEVSNG